MIGRALSGAALGLLLAIAGACAQGQPSPANQSANPASVICAQKGGELRIERRGDGGAYGVCVFTDNRQCEEWAMLRGQCPVGGLRVTGYVTPAARYCAITGGRYAIVAGSGTSASLGPLRFAAVLDATATDAETAVAALRESLRSNRPALVENASVAAGVTELVASDDPGTVLARAERAVEQAKLGGDGTVVVATVNGAGGDA